MRKKLMRNKQYFPKRLYVVAELENDGSVWYSASTELPDADETTACAVYDLGVKGEVEVTRVFK